MIIRDQHERPALVRPVLRQHHQMRREFEDAKAGAASSGWELVRIVAEIVETEAFRKWGYPSRNDWCCKELAGFYSSSAVTRLCGVWQKLERMDQEERAVYFQHSPWNVVEAFAADGGPDEARELLESGRNQHEIRHAVKERSERRQKLATGIQEVREGRWESLDIPDQPIEIVGQWAALQNLARFRLGRPTPSTTQILEHLFQDYMQNWQRDVDPRALVHTTSDGVRLEWTMADVAAGKIKCAMCGSYNIEALQPHHAVPRAQEKRCCGVDHAKPIVLLCGDPCHRSIKEGFEGNWKVWARTWGYGELVDSH